MNLSPDEIIFWQYGFFTLNLTVITTWGLMLFLVIASALITRNLKSNMQISRWQNMLEIIVIGIKNQIEEIGLKKPEVYIGFIGTMFLFIVTANVFIILPWYHAPTGSLSTTTALAFCVFLAVPFFGIEKSGVWTYLRSYLQPTFIMLPFNLISEISRTMALAIRLFGNMMSGGLIVAILLTISPFIFPVIMNVLGLLTGMVQAYIFSILSTVYIAAAVRDDQQSKELNSETIK